MCDIYIDKGTQRHRDNGKFHDSPEQNSGLGDPGPPFRGVCMHKMLPESCRLGVYTAYKYYRKLLMKLKKTPSIKIQSARIRVPNYEKMGVLAQSFLKFHLNLI